MSDWLLCRRIAVLLWLGSWLYSCLNRPQRFFRRVGMKLVNRASQLSHERLTRAAAR
jgi:hypothetical protein